MAIEFKDGVILGADSRTSTGKAIVLMIILFPSLLKVI